MLSVALCTYNGARYIREQIESILNQTMPVDEIVVCDDGSSDDTISIIQQTQLSSTKTTVRLYQNESSLGVANNFQKAVNLCNGDIIFLSDQDDVWNPEKTMTIVDWFTKNPTKTVVITDASLINSFGAGLSSQQNTLFKNTYNHIEQKLFESGKQLESFLFENHATGATMAIRRIFFEKYSFSDKCNDEILHDYVISLQAIQDGCLGIIKKKLISYRIHNHQTCGLVHNKISPKYQWNQIYKIRTSIIPLLRTNEAKESALFIIYRLRQTCRPLGCIRMLFHLKSYYHYYNIVALSVFMKDIRDWCKILLFQLSHVINHQQ